MRIKWLSHAGFAIEFQEKKILIDPWLTGNPLAKDKPEDFKEIDLILVTHDHGDHLGDSIRIAKESGATFISIYELSEYASSQGVKNIIGMNIGGTVEVNGIYITMVPAIHSASRGSPVGYVIRGENEKSIYHAGDTALFSDMQIIGEIYSPKIALLPIGGYYTMGPMEAAKAVELIKPEVVIPMHYNTFPVIQQDPNEFARLVKDKMPEVKVMILEVGEWITIN